jgi:hypothetical protein
MHERDFNAPSPAQELARPPLLPSPDPDLSFARPGRASSAAAAEAWSGRAGFDGRQIFFLFLASALGACLIFAAGLSVGRRIERKALTQAQEAAIADPLAALDDIANAEEALTFHRALLSGPAAQRRARRRECRGSAPVRTAQAPLLAARSPGTQARPRRAAAAPTARCWLSCLAGGSTDAWRHPVSAPGRRLSKLRGCPADSQRASVALQACHHSHTDVARRRAVSHASAGGAAVAPKAAAKRFCQAPILWTRSFTVN